MTARQKFSHPSQNHLVRHGKSVARSGVLDLDLLPDKLRSIREQVSHGGGTVLLLGVRRDESAMRSGSISRHAEDAVGRLTPDADHKGVGK